MCWRGFGPTSVEAEHRPNGSRRGILFIAMMNIKDLSDFLETAQDQKLNINQLVVLCYLSCKASYSATMTELAAVAGLSTAAMTGMVDMLESRLLVKRQPAVDRRVNQVVLEPKGARLFLKLGVSFPGLEQLAA